MSFMDPDLRERLEREAAETRLPKPSECRPGPKAPAYSQSELVRVAADVGATLRRGDRTFRVPHAMGDAIETRLSDAGWAITARVEILQFAEEAAWQFTVEPAGK